MSFVKESFLDATNVLNSFISNTDNLNKMDSAIKLFVESISNKGRIYSCGNGGSMCDAMHFAEELTGRFRKERRPLPAMAISDPSHITCVANDYGFDFIFSKFIEGNANSCDTLLAISTSGNSANVVNAVIEAKKKNMNVIALLGKGGGKLKDMADISLVVDSKISDRIQEIHIKCIHIFIEGIERNLFPENY